VHPVNGDLAFTSAPAARSSTRALIGYGFTLGMKSAREIQAGTVFGVTSMKVLRYSVRALIPDCFTRSILGRPHRLEFQCRWALKPRPREGRVSPTRKKARDKLVQIEDPDENEMRWSRAKLAILK